MNSYAYPATGNSLDITKFVTDYMEKYTQQITGKENQPETGAQAPVFHCQPVKDLKEVEDKKWFNSTPFVGLTEDGQFIGIRRWDGSATATEYFKRISPEELPKPPKPVTHEELAELLPAVLSQYIPNLLKQMGVSGNEQSTTNPAGGAIPVEQLPAITGGKSKGAVGTQSGETSGNK